jgi:yeast amino acid transporter
MAKPSSSFPSLRLWQFLDSCKTLVHLAKNHMTSYPLLFKPAVTVRDRKRITLQALHTYTDTITSILGICIDVGASPSGKYIGAGTWYNPGAFHNGFKGLCSVFVTAAFAFGGTELVGLAAAETQNPRKTLPGAIKQVFWRILLFYMVSLTIVGCLVPYDNEQLLNGSGSSDANASPFVIAIKNAGISGLPSVFNVVIMIAVLSVGNSAVYGSSRTLAALADNGQAPKILGYIDREGRPLVSIGVASAVSLLLSFRKDFPVHTFTAFSLYEYSDIFSQFGFLCFIVAAGSDAREQAFDWMLALSGLSSIFTWGSICLAHIRFRKAWHVQGHSLSELAFKSQPGVYGSWVGFIFNCLVVVAQFWTGFAPVGYKDMSSTELVQSWFQGCLSLPIVLLCYFSFKIVKRTRIRRAKEIDLQSGQREFNLAAILEQERAEKAQWPMWKKVYKLFC